MTETQEGDIEQWLEWGKELAQNNFHNEAIECFKIAIEMEPSRGEDLIFLGQAYAALGDHANALVLFDKALGRDSTLPEPNNYKGVSLEEMGCQAERNQGWVKASPYYRQALDCYNVALSNRKDYADALNNKGISLYRLHRYNEALACFDEVISLDPNSGDPWYNKSIVHDTMGLIGEAATDMARAIALGLSPEIKPIHVK